MECVVAVGCRDGVSALDRRCLISKSAGGPGRVDRVPLRHRPDRMRLENRADLVDLEDLACVLVQPGRDDSAAPLGGAARSDEAAARSPRLDQPERLEAREASRRTVRETPSCVDEHALGR